MNDVIYEAKMQPSSNSAAKKPVVSLVKGGKRAYIWVGDKELYASLEGDKLKLLAQAILKEMP